jgi:hypothetical protein
MMFGVPKDLPARLRKPGKDFLKRNKNQIRTPPTSNPVLTQGRSLLFSHAPVFAPVTIDLIL